MKNGKHLLSLINDVLKLGGVRERLEIKIFGGGRVLAHMIDIGARNIDFVRNYLSTEGLRTHAQALAAPRAQLFGLHAQGSTVTFAWTLPAHSTPKRQTSLRTRDHSTTRRARLASKWRAGRLSLSTMMQVSDSPCDCAWKQMARACSG